MHDIPLEDLLHHAETAARIGGAFAMEGMHRRGDVVTRSQHDVKIEMDVETQERIAEYLRNACPGHHLLGEEGGEQCGTLHYSILKYYNVRGGGGVSIVARYIIVF